MNDSLFISLSQFVLNFKFWKVTSTKDTHQIRKNLSLSLEGSIVGPLLFLLYINDIPQALSNSHT